MEYGRPEERAKDQITVMDIVFYVAKRMQVSIIYGGTAEHSTSIQTLFTSNFYKSGTRSKINRNVFGTQE
eukprot:14419937-Heterocapsa_arctica.AAC.1